MAESTEEATSTRRSPETEKPLDSSSPATIDMPEKPHSLDLSRDDAKSSHKAEDAAEKDAEGGMGDYLVSH
jgi:hypothetical protein